MEEKSILVLCDTHPFLMALSTTLASLVSTIYQTNDVSSARQLILGRHPDLVIIDFPAEGPTGIKELMTFIKAQECCPKTIAIYTLSDERLYVENLGFNEIFPRIFKIKEFLQKVKELLGE